jgi:hypothetical protein
VPTFKHLLYRDLGAAQSRILSDVEKAGEAIIPKHLHGKIAVAGTVSGHPVGLRKNVIRAIAEMEKDPRPLAALNYDMRTLVKEYYGDDYDGVLVSTGEAGLALIYEAFAAPPMGRGEPYETSYIVPYERHIHHHGAYGRPFPPKYRDIFAERGVTPGELGQTGKRIENLRTVIVPLVGGDYTLHGVKQHPGVLLTRVKAAETSDRVAEMAERFAGSLSAIASLAYDTPSYGYGEKDPDGVPTLQRLYSDIARRFNIPYVADNATGVPFVGNGPQDIGADLMVYSMDKIARAPHCGFVIGREEYLYTLNRAMGVNPGRTAAPAYGKAGYVTFDPGRQAMTGVIEVMKATLARDPADLERPVNLTYEIVLDELKTLPAELRDKILITKTHHNMGVELTVHRTWDDGAIGFPIHCAEDNYAGTNVFQNAIGRMGVEAAYAYDGTIGIRPGGRGTLDDDGVLIEDNMRYVVRGVFKSIEVIWEHWQQIVARHAGSSATAPIAMARTAAAGS